MKRIYFPGNIENTVTLDDSNHNYLKNVLRLGAGDAVEILTPAELLKASVEIVRKKDTTLRVLSRRAVQQPDYKFTLYQCILKREYMDTVVEKYTEIGVTHIVPVISERSIGEVKENTLRRFHEIIKSASLQCERESLPRIVSPVKLSEIMPEKATDNIIFYERHHEKSVPRLNGRNIKAVIGPEGGFTEEEITLLTGRGFMAVSPLSRVLKAETAAVVFAGLLQVQLERS